MGQPRRAATNSAPVPGCPVQEHSVRRVAGSAGWEDHSSRTGPPRTRAIAHSTWGATASGAECTYTTPLVGMVPTSRTRLVFPNAPQLRRNRHYSVRLDNASSWVKDAGVFTRMGHMMPRG